jgi:hypothetical protein
MYAFQDSYTQLATDMALLTEGGTLVTALYKHGPPDGGQHARPESHQRSWWIVHTRPTMPQSSRSFCSPSTQYPTCEGDITGPLGWM